MKYLLKYKTAALYRSRFTNEVPSKITNCCIMSLMVLFSGQCIHDVAEASYSSFVLKKNVISSVYIKLKESVHGYMCYTQGLSILFIQKWTLLLVYEMFSIFTYKKLQLWSISVNIESIFITRGYSLTVFRGEWVAYY